MIRKTFVVPMFALIGASSAWAETPVVVRDLGELLTVRELRAPASVIAANRTVITSQVTALIRELAVDVGQVVAANDLLVKLEPADAELAVAEAEAQLASIQARIADARRRLSRAEELLASEFVSDDEFNARRTELEVLEADQKRQRVAVQSARLALNRTVINAPFRGAVVGRQGQVGDLATPGAPLMTLVQLDDREVDAEIDPGHAGRLEEATFLRFVSERRTWPVELARLSPVIEVDSRKIRGRFRFTKEAAPVGSTGELLWSESGKLLPVDLVVRRGKQLGFFSVREGQAVFVPLLSAQEGRPAEVRLPDETPVVTRGHVRLQHGDAVQIAGE